MTMTRIYKSIYSGGIDDYQQALSLGFNVVISLIDVPKLSSATHHKIAPLCTDLSDDYRQNAQEIIELLDLSLSKDWKVLVHCYQGKMRSQGLIKAYAKLRDPDHAPDQIPFSLAFFDKYLIN